MQIRSSAPRVARHTVGEKPKEKEKKCKGGGCAPKPKTTSKAGSKGASVKHYAVKPMKNSARRGKQGKAKLKSEKGQFRLRVSGSGTLRRVARILKGELTPRQALAAMFRSPKTAVAGTVPGTANLVLVHSMDWFTREAAPELWLKPDRKNRRPKPVLKRVEEDEVGGFLIARIA